MNTPRLITDTNGNTVWKWESDPFGVTPPNEDPGNTGTSFKFNLRFPGQYADQETNTFYNGFRDYDPTTGRYLESDPIGLAGGQLSTYSYVKGNPLSRIDPKGLWSFTYDNYEGLGFSLTVGRDNSTGEWFWGGRVGIGLQEGFNFDPMATRPGAEKTGQCSGTTLGTFYQAGATVGPYSWNAAQAAAGVDYPSGKTYNEGPTFGNFITFVPGGFGVDIGGSFGVEVINHSGK